jgi:hypothetical protein
MGNPRMPRRSRPQSKLLTRETVLRRQRLAAEEVHNIRSTRNNLALAEQRIQAAERAYIANAQWLVLLSRLQREVAKFVKKVQTNPPKSDGTRMIYTGDYKVRLGASRWYYHPTEIEQEVWQVGAVMVDPSTGQTSLDHAVYILADGTFVLTRKHSYTKNMRVMVDKKGNQHENLLQRVEVGKMDFDVTLMKTVIYTLQGLNA